MGEVRVRVKVRVRDSVWLLKRKRKSPFSPLNVSTNASVFKEEGRADVAGGVATEAEAHVCP